MYHVAWHPQAQLELADAWLACSNRNAVTSSSNWLENQLGFQPLRFGRPVISSVHRRGSDGVLEVEFEIIEDDKKVIVLAVGLAPRN
jgi:hypothetical protein